MKFCTISLKKNQKEIFEISSYLKSKIILFNFLLFFSLDLAFIKFNNEILIKILKIISFN